MARGDMLICFNVNIVVSCEIADCRLLYVSLRSCHRSTAYSCLTAFVWYCDFAHQ